MGDPGLGARGKVLVTGGTGFIGRRLVERLVSDGCAVRVLGRSANKPFPLPPSPFPPQFIPASITDAPAVSRAVAGVHTVFHLAGCAKAWTRTPDEFYDVNVRGTEHVMAACLEHDVRRLVHFSTALVESEKPLTTEYQRSKRQGEQVLRDAVGTTTAVIVRPTRVYGPGLLSVANSATKVIDLYRRGLFRIRIADRDARANYVHVDDVVEGTVHAADFRPDSPSVAAFALGGEDATMREFLAAIAEATGQRRFVGVLPKTFAKGLGYLSVGVARLGVDPLITPEWVDLLAMDWPVSSDAARHAFGYCPRRLADGVRDTVDWLERGYAANSLAWQSS